MTETTGRAHQGRARSAIVTLQNFQGLLESPRVLPRVLRELVPEVTVACEVLRRSFEEWAAESGAHGEVVAYALARLPVVTQETSAAAQGGFERARRGTLAKRLGVPLGELETCTELLELAQRGLRHAPTAHDLAALARAALELAPTRAHGAALEVCLDVSRAEGSVLADAHVVARLVAFALSGLVSAAPPPLCLRAEAHPSRAMIHVEIAEGRGVLPRLKVTPLLPILPATGLVDEVASSVGITLARTNVAVTLGLVAAPLPSTA